MGFHGIFTVTCLGDPLNQSLERWRNSSNELFTPDVQKIVSSKFYLRTGTQ